VRARAYAWDSLEKIDNSRLSKWAHDRRDQEPDVPLIYLAARWMRPTRTLSTTLERVIALANLNGSS
jgi:hypothetical protein